jgi:hypothetical protein
MRGLISFPMMRADLNDVTTASRGLGETMSAFPSDVIYQASATHRQELLADATAHRRAAQAAPPPSGGTTMISLARLRLGRFLIALGYILVRRDEVVELTPAVES